ncbi:MAG: DMP19 family protein, partial [Prevotella sp.]|nr:DMP19 family protein [Prevotella sp.]
REAIGGEITAENMQQMSTAQTVLMGYAALRDEVMDGGFIQLIYNGYGPFFFHNPFAKVMRMWGVDDLAKLMNKVRKKYEQYHEEIERDCTDEEFMAMFERFPAFDEFDDEFVECEEDWTAQVAQYIDEHIGQFVVVKK